MRKILRAARATFDRRTLKISLVGAVILSVVGLVATWKGFPWPGSCTLGVLAWGAGMVCYLDNRLASEYLRIERDQDDNGQSSD